MSSRLRRSEKSETAAIANIDSPEARLIAEVTRLLFLERELESMALHDPLAVAVAVEPALVTTVPGPVIVETLGEHTRGQTIVDWRRHRVRPAVDRPHRRPRRPPPTSPFDRRPHA